MISKCEWHDYAGYLHVHRLNSQLIADLATLRAVRYVPEADVGLALPFSIQEGQRSLPSRALITSSALY